MAKEISLDTLYPKRRQDTVTLNYHPVYTTEGTDTVLSNGIVTIRVSLHGAELQAIRSDETGREYLWQADPKYWKRHSPVLFPIVGSVWNGKYRSHGSEFALGQHGFARDMDFLLIEEGTDAEGNPQALYVLRSSEATLAKYPYRFRLEIGYVLKGRAVEVIWRVMNPSREEELHFQIGAHPAFYWPLLSNADIEAGVTQQDAVLSQSTARGYFRLSDGAKTYRKSVITEKGCVDPAQSGAVTLDAEGYLPLDTETFAHDALIFEDSQVQTVTLCDADRRPYLTLRSEAPLMGLWSPPGKNAPFVCIEPWYGRCDRVQYDGKYEDKDWIQTLAPLATFESRYQIILG